MAHGVRECVRMLRSLEVAPTEILSPRRSSWVVHDAQIVFVYVCTQNEFTFLFELFWWCRAAAPLGEWRARTKKHALQPHGAFLLLKMLLRIHQYSDGSSLRTRHEVLITFFCTTADAPRYEKSASCLSSCAHTHTQHWVVLKVWSEMNRSRTSNESNCLASWLFGRSTFELCHNRKLFDIEHKFLQVQFLSTVVPHPYLHCLFQLG
jgi:hypothetical protein